MRLTNINGGVTFEAWDRSEVRIEAEKRVKAGSDEAARKLMSQIRIEVANTASGLRIETRLPKREEGGILSQLFSGDGDVNMDVSYKIHVPRHVALNIEGSNGAIAVTGHGARPSPPGGLKSLANGRITVARLAGSLQAETSNGAIDAELTELASGDLRLERPPTAGSPCACRRTPGSRSTPRPRTAASTATSPSRGGSRGSTASRGRSTAAAPGCSSAPRTAASHPQPLGRAVQPLQLLNP